MNARPELYLTVSLDVEEEGLFGGQYARRGCTTANTACLERLIPLCDVGVRPTLFCAHSVLADPASLPILARLRDHCNAEIGAHLHHWNTPPLALPGTPEPPDTAAAVPAIAVSPELMAAKLATLMAVGRSFQGAPLTSFRMGRWDLHRAHWPLLAQAGVLADASVRPLHCARSPLQGPDHFDAPTAPYWAPVADKAIFELPLTVTPLVQALPGLLRTAPGKAGVAMRAGFRQWGALALLLVYHPLWAMRRITSLFVARGGRVLSLTWHSSEMMPGGAPHMPDAAAVDRLLHKILSWLHWLNERYQVRCLTLDELRRAMGPTAPTPTPPAVGDWTCAPLA